jgi:hypothetical protein
MQRSNLADLTAFVAVANHLRARKGLNESDYAGG